MPKSNIEREIEKILEDCEDEEEELSAWEMAFQDNVETPFAALLLGVSLEVQDFRLGNAGNIQCQIQAGDIERWISVEDLDETNLPDDFDHYLKLYQAWCSEDY